ncbi:MAG: LacI family DNA-binding transcriptional regulator, partial [Pseudomonadota bacterium]
MFEYQMPSTISDIARASGLSTATVDRALHGRGGVSAANRQRVLSTARELGYLPMEGAVALPSRAVRLAFLIPRLDSAFMAEIARTLEARAAAHPLVAQCEIIPLDAIGPAAFQDGLAHLPDGVDRIGAITTDHPKTRAALSHLTASGLPLITLASDIAGPRAGYVGIDNRAAGRTAAQLTALFAGAQPGTVALCLGSRAFMGHAERERGFMEALPNYAPNLACLNAIETSEDPERMRRAVASLMRREPALRAIY